MSSKLKIVLGAAGILAAIAGHAFAGLNGTTVSLSCDIAAKEFAGPVTVKNTSSKAIAVGKTITVVVHTAYGKENEKIVLKKALLPGQTVRGTNTYQNTGSCTASVFYPSPIKPRA